MHPHIIPLLPNIGNTCFISVVVQMLRTLTWCTYDQVQLDDPSSDMVPFMRLLAIQFPDHDFRALILRAVASCEKLFPKQYTSGQYFRADSLLYQVLASLHSFHQSISMRTTETTIFSCRCQQPIERNWVQHTIDIHMDNQLTTLAETGIVITRNKNHCKTCKQTAIQTVKLDTTQCNSLILVMGSSSAMKTLPPPTIHLLRLSAIVLGNGVHFVIYSRRGSVWFFIDDDQYHQINSTSNLNKALLAKLSRSWRVSMTLYTSNFASVFGVSTIRLSNNDLFTSLLREQSSYS